MNEPDLVDLDEELEPEATDEPIADEATDDTPAEDTPEPIADEVLDPDEGTPSAPIPALQATRHRAQDAERELIKAQAERDALQALLTQQAQPAQTPEPTPEAPSAFNWDNPDLTLQQQQQFIEAKFDALKQENESARFDLSESYARRAHADYDEKKAVFLDAMAKNPELQQQLLASADPGDFAYTQGARITELEQYGGDPAKRDEAIAAKAVEDYKASLKKASQLTKDVPGSLSEKSTSAPSDKQIVPDGALVDIGGFALDQ